MSAKPASGREPEEPQFLRLSVVAKRLNVTRKTVLNWVRDGHLRGYRFVNEYRVHVDDLDEFLTPVVPDRESD